MIVRVGLKMNLAVAQIMNMRKLTASVSGFLPTFGDQNLMTQ